MRQNEGLYVRSLKVNQLMVKVLQVRPGQMCVHTDATFGWDWGGPPSLSYLLFPSPSSLLSVAAGDL